MKITKKEVLIGILAIAVLVITGCTKIQESAPRYAQGVTYLNSCELVRDQVQYTFGPKTADSVFQRVDCPVGKIPISNSVILSAYGFQPVSDCEEYFIESGGHYSGMAYTIVARNCLQDRTYEYERSMVCCSGILE